MQQGRVGPEAVWRVHVQSEVGICYSALPLFKRIAINGENGEIS